MWWHRIIIFFLVILIFIIHNSFIINLPLFFQYLDVLLLIVILILVLYGWQRALYLGLFFGLLVDMHSFYFFGLNIISIIGAVIIANIFLTKFFTNRSFYFFILITLTTVLSYEILKLFILFINNFIFKNLPYPLVLNINYFLTLFYKLTVNAIAVIIIFYIATYFSKALKPFIIIKSKTTTRYE